MLDSCDGAVLMQQVGWLVERRLRSKLWEARLEGRYDGEVELESLVAFNSGILDVRTEKEMHALGCDVIFDKPTGGNAPLGGPRM